MEQRQHKCFQAVPDILIVHKLNIFRDKSSYQVTYVLRTLGYDVLLPCPVSHLTTHSCIKSTKLPSHVHQNVFEEYFTACIVAAFAECLCYMCVNAPNCINKLLLLGPVPKHTKVNAGIPIGFSLGFGTDSSSRQKMCVELQNFLLAICRY